MEEGLSLAEKRGKEAKEIRTFIVVVELGVLEQNQPGETFLKVEEPGQEQEEGQ